MENNITNVLDHRNVYDYIFKQGKLINNNIRWGIGIEIEYPIFLDVTKIYENQVVHSNADYYNNKLHEIYNNKNELYPKHRIFLPINRLFFLKHQMDIIQDLYKFLKKTKINTFFIKNNIKEDFKNLYLNYTSTDNNETYYIKKIALLSIYILKQVEYLSEINYDHMGIKKLCEILTNIPFHYGVTDCEDASMFSKLITELTNLKSYYGIEKYINKKNFDIKKTINYGNLKMNFNLEDGYTSDEKIEIKTNMETINKPWDKISTELESSKYYAQFMIKNLFGSNFDKKNILTYTNSIYPSIITAYNIIKNNIILEPGLIGSQHLNITFPYVERKLSDPKYVIKLRRDHVKSMKIIQLLEPLILAVFTKPSIGTFYDNNKIIETSNRLLQSSYSNFLIKSIKADYYKITQNNGYGQRVRDVSKGLLKIHKKLKKKQIIPYKTDLIQDIGGSDFRTDYSQIMRMINNNYNDRTINPLYDDYDSEAEQNPDLETYDDSSSDGYVEGLDYSFFGFEFRMLDLFDLKYLNDIVKLFFMIFYIVSNNNTKFLNQIDPITILTETDEYINFIEQIFIEGWNTKLEPKYVQLLYNIFQEYKIDLNIKKTKNCYDLFNEIFIQLKKIIGDKDGNHLMNLNKISFNENLDKYHKNTINDIMFSLMCAKIYTSYSNNHDLVINNFDEFMVLINFIDNINASNVQEMYNKVKFLINILDIYIPIFKFGNINSKKINDILDIFNITKNIPKEDLFDVYAYYQDNI